MFVHLGTHPSLIHICSSIWGHIPPSSIYVRPFGDTSLPHPYMFIHLGSHPASSICVHPFGDTSLPHSYIFIHLGTHPSLIHICSSIFRLILPSFCFLGLWNCGAVANERRCIKASELALLHHRAVKKKKGSKVQDARRRSLTSTRASA